MSSGSVLISWNPPQTPNGVILRYRVERLQSTPDGFTEVVTVPGTSTPLAHTDSSLLPFTVYYYRVVAENSAGSVTSQSASVRTPEAGEGMKHEMSDNYYMYLL